MHNFTEFSKTYDARILDSSIRSMYGGNYYNVGDWEGSHKSLGQACIALTERHIEYLQPRPGWKVIDVGCGLGAATGKIAQTYPDVTIIGVNISHSQLSYAKTRYPSVDFCLMNACSLAIGNESLDGIISIEAAFHFPSRFDFLREAHRSLKSGGRMVFSDILFNSTEPLGEWWIPEGISAITRKEYESFCAHAGFNVVSVDDITDITWKPFCRFLGRHIGDSDYGQKLEDSVSAYLLVVLEKTN